MIIGDLLELLKKLERVNTSDWFGEYSSRYVWRKYFQRELRRTGWRPKKEWLADKKKEELEKFYKMLSVLKRQGFVKKTKNNNLWEITSSGLQKLKSVYFRRQKMPITLRPSKLVRDNLKIVVFDIPESLKHYRNWFRRVLLNFTYRMLQKSVWIGDVKLPEELIYKIKRYGLTDYVHIFSVKDKGTLED